MAGARARAPSGTSVTDDDLTVLVPAFVVTELTEAFAIGFLVFLPFLVIDLVISNVLLALGMQMMSPTQVSLPFKLLLFVAIDGWGLLVAGARRRVPVARAARLTLADVSRAALTVRALPPRVESGTSDSGQ